MAFYNNAIIAEVQAKARFFNFDGQQVRSWNQHRRGEELRLVTGWTWVPRDVFVWYPGDARPTWAGWLASLPDGYRCVPSATPHLRSSSGSET